MQSVQSAEKWDLLSKQHAPPLSPSHPPPTRPSHVNPHQAKRIIFYKSGDSQFGGVKMAVHRRSFKCFDALLDDLSQKVPLPFGVRTVTTPRGTHTIRHLEQLQDGGCYLCSDRRQAKPINMDIASKRHVVWSHHGRRPHRPESTSDSPPGHVPYRQRRLLLVKNTEPGVRRSVVLSRRVTRSLRAFLEEASDVMQFHVRKLYTVEGRKIDNVQSLMTCPSVLVCVGREAFSPLLVNYIRKSSDEKLPGLGPGNGARSPSHGAQSRASEHSEPSQDSKKNMMNFGLETKKSIIHPRSDSSTRSARFSMSSEKSYGLSTVSQGRAAILNDDIEKRVVVNKDGSLSVEMRVRFRLQSDETLQWSTEIKKSPSLTTDSCSLNQGQAHDLQHEICSDPDCHSYETENGDYSSHCAVEANTCPCCYRQDQQYDLWKNPAHNHRRPIPPNHSTTESHTILRHTHSSSSTSSCNSTRVVRCRARLTNREDGSEHSQIVQEEMCVTEQRVTEQEVHTVSRSCSRSEVVADGDEVRPLSSKSGKEEVERAMSDISASSRVLQELREDDDELPPSASRCGDAISETSEMENNDKTASDASVVQNGITEEEECSTCRCQSTSEVEANGRVSTAKSKVSSCKSTKETANDEIEEAKTFVSGLSAGSRQSATSLCPDCGGWKAKMASGCNSSASNRSNKKSSRPASSNSAIDLDDNSSNVSTLSNTSNLTYHREVSEISNWDCKATLKTEDEEVEETRAISVTSSTSGNKNDENIEIRSPSVVSTKSENSACNAVPDPTTREETAEDNSSQRVASAMSAKSTVSAKSNCTHKSSIKITAPTTEEEEEGKRSPSVQSEKSNASVSVKSTKSEKETRAASVHSVKSNESVNASRPASAKSNVSEKSQNGDEDKRVASVLSVKSNKSRSASPSSVKSSKSKVSEKTSENEEQNLEVQSVGNESRSASALSVKSIKSEASKKSEKVKDETRAESALSVKSNATAKSTKSAVSEKSAQNETENMDENDESVAEESRPASAISVKSTNSERAEKVLDEDARPASVVSVKSKSAKESRPSSTLSVTTSKSHVSEKSKSENVEVEEEARPDSKISSKSNATNKTEQRSLSPRSNAEKDVEERGESAMSNKSRKSMKSNGTEIGQNGEQTEEERAASAVSSKSALSVKSSKTTKSSRLASPARQQEGERALSANSNKTNNSTVSARSKKSNQTVISANIIEENDNRSGTVTSPVSVRSNKSSRFHVVTIKTPEVSGNDRPASSASDKTEKSNVSKHSKQNKMADVDNDTANESLVEDEASAHSKCTQELMPGEQRGASSLSVQSGKSVKSKCSCGKTNKTKDDIKEDSEVAASISSAKRDDLDEDSFASVSLVLPEDQDSESAESHVSSQRILPKTATPEVSKSPENAGESGPNTPIAINIPTIETPGHNHQEEDASEEKSRAVSSCSTKSTRSIKSNSSKKSCSNCGKLTTQVDAKSEASSVVSVKSITTTKTDQLAAPDNRTTSAMSNISDKSEKKRAKHREVVESSEECAEQASETKVENDKRSRVSPKPPSTLRPKSGASNRSTNSNKTKKDVLSVKSSQNKEENVKSPSPQNDARAASKGETCSESMLSHSLSAADLAKEAKAAERPESSRSKVSRTSNKSQKSKKESTQQLTPSCLPNASPNEVVSDWLNRIPANMLTLGDDDGDKCVEDIETGNGIGDEAEVKGEDAEVKTEEEEEGGEKEEEKEEGGVETFEIRQVGMVTETSLPKNWHSSAVVMKALLSSSLGRCRSMPEVSPVYGRRLSASAKELLDCLTQLQLIEPAGPQTFSVQKDQRPQFEDVISLLQSLWLAEPRDIVDLKDPSGTDQVSPPRSSSGVGMSSGSGGSGKDNINQEQEDESKKEEENKTEEASQSPEDQKTTENPSSLDKNCRTPTDNEFDTADTQECSTSDSPPTVVRAPLSKRLSQDPDPIWVMRLLKKLEKQFINHYVTAMDDFKVKWDLEDSLILDRMITELREEVSQRIEKSVEREMKKIQGRAGKIRVPRPPPGGYQSTDSVMTEKRRQMLRVMKNHSVKTGDSQSEDDLTGENSDQRSDDEYCPCEACIAKKMASRPVKVNPSAIQAPIQKEFDLLKILLFKTAPAAPVENVKSENSNGAEEDGRNLEVVKEEEEEATSEDAEEEAAEEAKCQCQCSKEEDEEETEDSDKETVKEKSSHKEDTMEEASEGEEEEERNEEETEGGESEEVSTEERTSEQENRPAVTEGEDADGEDSGTEGSTEPKREKTDTSLLHQFTRTSVESQSGSLEDVSPGAINRDVPKLASPGGTLQKRSRSPARVKRRKPQNSDSDLDNV